MRFLDLFAGIGGISLGLERAGMTCAGHVEINPFCQQVLKKHWPDVPLIADVKEVRGDEFGHIDVLTGGYPCQPFSLAGSRGGKTDSRHLWPEVARIIRAIRPQYALLENVTGHLSLGFGDVLGDLAACGYDAEWQCIPAAAVGAPHLRDRTFIVAYPAGQRPQEDGEHIQVLSAYPTGDSRTWNGRRVAEPRIQRVVDGVPYQLDRLRALGNAVVPQVAQYLGEQIMAAEQQATE